VSSATQGSAEGLGRSLPDLPIGHLAAPLSTLSFWVAIALPVFYLPLLLAGIDDVGDLGLFFGLFGLHVLALILGHPYGTPGEP
jgi:hypothetical protein